MEICQFKVYIQKVRIFLPHMDKMAELLRLRTVNPLRSARVGLSPIFSFFFFKQKTAYEMLRSLVGSEMCIRDRSSAIDKVIFSKLTSHLKHRTAGNTLFSYFVFF